MPTVVAHRGVRNLYPENTLVGFQAALAVDVAGIEFDVEITQDNIPVVVHQETLVPDASGLALTHGDRNPNNRWVNTSPSAYVCSLDAGSWLAKEFSDTRVPLFSEVVGLSWKQTQPYIELKDPFYWTQRNHEYEDRLLDATLPMLVGSGLEQEKVRLLSFNEHLLIAAKKRSFQGKLVLNVWRDRASQRTEVITLAQSIGVSVIDIAEDMALNDPLWISECHNAGLSLFTYEVSPARNEPEFGNWNVAARIPAWEQLVSLGVDGIVSDFPLELIRFLDSSK
jgi:glycerophosphoryl diester phosphodiesterase